MIDENYWKNQFKPWVESYIDYFSLPKDADYSQIMDHAKQLLFDQGYEAARAYVQGLDRGDWQSMAKSAGGFLLDHKAYLWVGIPALAVGAFLLRRST